MPTSQTPGLFVTGTDTGVGKTYVAARIAAALAATGCRVGVYKPVASGCRQEGDTLVSEDAEQLWQAAGRPGEFDRVCPQRFAAPLAPHLAARAAGQEVSAELLRSGLDYWRSASDIVIVEGAGGLLSPISDDQYVADLALEFGFPLIVVADNRLGTIHRTLSTLVVAATYGDGMEVAGVVLNEPAAPQDDPSAKSNLAELEARAVPPILGLVKPNGQLPYGVKWRQLAGG